MIRLILTVLILTVLSGCASHFRKNTVETPLGKMEQQCSETANGSTACFTDVKQDAEPTAHGAGYHPFAVRYAGGYQPVVELGPTGPTQAEMNLRMIGGGIAVVEKTDPRVDTLEDTVEKHEENLDVLNAATTKLVKRAKEKR